MANTASRAIVLSRGKNVRDQQDECDEKQYCSLRMTSSESSVGLEAWRLRETKPPKTHIKYGKPMRSYCNPSSMYYRVLNRLGRGRRIIEAVTAGEAARLMDDECGIHLAVCTTMTLAASST